MQRLLFILLVLQNTSLCAQNRTLNEIDRVRGYLEFHIGKKYKLPLSQEEKQERRHKPDILKYTHFYGVPIHTMHVYVDKHQRIERLHFTFEHSSSAPFSRKKLLDILNANEFAKVVRDQNNQMIERIWQLRKVILLLREYPNCREECFLELQILGVE